MTKKKTKEERGRKVDALLASLDDLLYDERMYRGVDVAVYDRQLVVQDGGNLLVLSDHHEYESLECLRMLRHISQADIIAWQDVRREQRETKEREYHERRVRELANRLGYDLTKKS